MQRQSTRFFVGLGALCASATCAPAISGCADDAATHDAATHDAGSAQVICSTDHWC